MFGGSVDMCVMALGYYLWVCDMIQLLISESSLKVGNLGIKMALY